MSLSHLCLRVLSYFFPYFLQQLEFFFFTIFANYSFCAKRMQVRVKTIKRGCVGLIERAVLSNWSPGAVWRDFFCILIAYSVVYPFFCALLLVLWRGLEAGDCTVFFFCAFSTNYNNPWRSVSGECCRVGGGGGCIGSCEVEMWQFLGISCCWCCAGVWVAAMGQSIKVFGAFIKTSSLLQSALITDS